MVRLGDTAPDFTADTTRARSTSTSGWATAGASCSPTRRTSRRSARPSSATSPRSSRSSTSATSRSSACRVDPVDDHEQWAEDIEETQGTALNFPMIGDPDRKVADLYDMIHPNASDTVDVRSVFVIGPDKKVKLTLTYPASTGRNFDEILRVIDSLQLTAEATRSRRRPTGSTARTSSSSRPVSDDEAKELFPSGWKPIKPYLRIVPQPNLRRARPPTVTRRRSPDRPFWRAAPTQFASTHARTGGASIARWAAGSLRTIVALIGTLSRSASTTTGSAPRRRAVPRRRGRCEHTTSGPVSCGQCVGTARSTAATAPRQPSRSAGRGRPR